MGEGGRDHPAVGVLDAVEIDEMQQQMRKALGDRARSQHLRQRRIAFALEGQAFDQADREVRDLDGQ